MAAGGDDIIAHMVLGYRYSDSIMVPKDCDKAVYHYHKMARNTTDHFKKASLAATNKLRLGKLGKNAHGPSISDHDIIHYYQYASEQGDITAQV